MSKEVKVGQIYKYVTGDYNRYEVICPGPICGEYKLGLINEPGKHQEHLFTFLFVREELLLNPKYYKLVEDVPTTEEYVESFREEIKNIKDKDYSMILDVNKAFNSINDNSRSIGDVRCSLDELDGETKGEIKNIKSQIRELTWKLSNAEFKIGSNRCALDVDSNRILRLAKSFDGLQGKVNGLEKQVNSSCLTKKRLLPTLDQDTIIILSIFATGVVISAIVGTVELIKHFN